MARESQKRQGKRRITKAKTPPKREPSRARATRTIYRDTETGRFVSKSTWTRSRTHGGQRYRRQALGRTKPTRKRKAVRPAPRPMEAPTLIEELEELEEELESEALDLEEEDVY